MIVGAAGHELVPAGQDGLRHRFGVGYDRMRIVLEFRRQRLVERDRFGGDHMHQRAALEAGEDRRVDLLGQVLVVGEDHAAARPAQRLVGGGRDDMGVRERRRVRSARDQPCKMCDVDDEIGADCVADRAETLEVPVPGVGRSAGDDELWLMLARQRLDLVHVDAVGRAVDPVGHRLEPPARHVHGRAVSQMSPCCEIEAHERVAGLHQRHERALIRLAARIRLNVGVAAVKQHAGALDRERLGDIDELAAAVITPARIAFRVFVGQHRPLSLQYGARHDVFRGDEFDLIALAAEFEFDRAGDFRVGCGERRRKRTSWSGPASGR